VFGFFLEGSDINGTTGNTIVNLATIPGTSTPVAINTINQGFPSGSYPATNCTNANPAYVAHSIFYAGNNPIVSLSGNTLKFTAKAQVKCGNAYNIRLKLANASDHALSSAVFLEANSFTSPTIQINSTLNSGNSFQDSTVVEGCAPSIIQFDKDGNKQVDMTIHFNYSGNAIAGVDYATLPDSLFIPAGKAGDTLFIEAFDDGVVELNDSLVIDMQPVVTTCAAYPSQRVIVHFRDKTPVSSAVSLSSSTDTIYCPGDTVGLVGSFTNGEGILTGWWQDDTLAAFNRTVSPLQTTTYYFEATDECRSDTAIDSITIYLSNYIPMELTGDTIMICRGDTVGMLAKYEFGNAPHNVIWYDGTLGDYLERVPTADSTWYVFNVVDDCKQGARDSVLVYMAPDASAGFNYMNDAGVPLKILFFNTSINGASYHWDFGDDSTSTDSATSHIYASPAEYIVTLTVTTKDGCIDTYTTIVKVETDFYLYVPTAFTPDGDGLNETFLIKGLGFESYEIWIFNRWGTEVYHSNDITEAWDGSFNGKAVPQGVYTYSIFIKMPLGDVSEKKGTFTLYR